MSLAAFRSLTGAALVGALALALAACAGAPATQPVPTAVSAQPAPTVAAQSAVGGEAGGEGGVEAALVTYQDAAQHFAIGRPGPWTQDPSVTDGVRFNGGDDFMRLQFVTPPAGADAMAYAKQDAAAAAKEFPGFTQVGLAPSTEVDKAIVLGFTAQGTSAVTGKSYQARGDRYYIPQTDGRIAVITVLGPASHYDREGVRDIALTLKVTN